MSVSYHSADKGLVRRHARYVCLACGRIHVEGMLQRDAWGDFLCPHCGSLRVERRATRSEVLRHFLIEYNRY